MRKHKTYRKKTHSSLISLYYTCLIPLFCYLLMCNLEGHVSELIAASVLLILLPFLLKILKRYMKKRRYLHSTLYAIDHMSGFQFEEFLKAHFERSGYSVQLTPKSNDYGIDLICRKKGAVNKKKDSFAVQAKRYNGKVGISAVQQVIGGMRFYDCENGIVITNNYFTKNAWDLAAKSGVELWDRSTLTKKFKIR